MDSLRTILDTSVVIGNRLDEIDGELAISAITLADLHFGVLVASDPQARALRLQRWNAGSNHSPSMPEWRAASAISPRWCARPAGALEPALSIS